jgi:hypothetical protein
VRTPCHGRTSEFFYDGPRPIPPEDRIRLRSVAQECLECAMMSECRQLAYTLDRHQRAYSVWGGLVFASKGRPYRPTKEMVLT